eukprot:TRINITY_DN65060_c0_g1_i1.p1 TRINITY_DN65060_c0_g1~~TRINITY_DN65060_c0_g1_i1.p1  ORF type:complete len:419 (+),score=22.64 TRINITY_DN65060_c0_g1_i1:45-1301(+)
MGNTLVKNGDVICNVYSFVQLEDIRRLLLTIRNIDCYWSAHRMLCSTATPKVYGTNWGLRGAADYNNASRNGYQLRQTFQDAKQLFGHSLSTLNLVCINMPDAWQHDYRDSFGPVLDRCVNLRTLQIQGFHGTSKWVLPKGWVAPPLQTLHLSGLTTFDWNNCVPPLLLGGDLRRIALKADRTSRPKVIPAITKSCAQTLKHCRLETKFLTDGDVASMGTAQWPALRKLSMVAKNTIQATTWKALALSTPALVHLTLHMGAGGAFQDIVDAFCGTPPHPILEFIQVTGSDFKAVDDEVIKHFARVGNTLSTLYLQQGAGLSDTQLANILPQLPKLDHLGLSRMQFADEFLLHHVVQATQLKYLGIVGCAVLAPLLEKFVVALFQQRATFTLNMSNSRRTKKLKLIKRLQQQFPGLNVV